LKGTDRSIAELIRAAVCQGIHSGSRESHNSSAKQDEAGLLNFDACLALAAMHDCGEVILMTGSKPPSFTTGPLF